MFRDKHAFTYQGSQLVCLLVAGRFSGCLEPVNLQMARAGSSVRWEFLGPYRDRLGLLLASFLTCHHPGRQLGVHVNH